MGMSPTSGSARAQALQSKAAMPTTAEVKASRQDVAEPWQVDVCTTHLEQRGHVANIGTKTSSRSLGIKLAEPALVASTTPDLQRVKQNMTDHRPGQHQVFH